jgi:hypothetical protein
VRCHECPSEGASGRLSVRILIRRVPSYRLHERRGATTWNFYAVIGDEPNRRLAPRSEWPI